MLQRLKKRREFLDVAASGNKMVTRTMVVQFRPHDSTQDCRVGFTVTKRQGGAVIRNRIRRRLKEAFRLAYNEKALPGWDIVIIGRHTALNCPFETMMEDMRYVMRRLRRQEESTA